MAEARGVTKHLFAEHFGGERAEFEAVNKTVENAFTSKIPGEYEAAEEFHATLMKLDKDKVKNDDYDKANTFNDLAKYIGDIAAMNNKLQELVSAIDSAADKYNNAEVTVQSP
ncbi:MAG: hypothetical protein LBP19_03235 [Treponema sp.]|jgi:hypothetical protein|nr:hypothetical protein [Treponema sp.]